MIIGNGMLSRSLLAGPVATRDACLFASGVANSRCEAPREFDREKPLLQASLASHPAGAAFVYFGTCSAYDPSARQSPYVLHKLGMERRVRQHPDGLVIRLPQLVGPGASPHTLASSLCASIRAGTPMQLWTHATRNIIDVVDVVRIVNLILATPIEADTVNVANPVSNPVREVISTLEGMLGMNATVTEVDAGTPYDIDIAAIQPLIANAGLEFGAGYLRCTYRAV